MFQGFSCKKIFLTGGTGFFGKSILDRISRGFLPGTEWVILSRNPGKFLAEYPVFASLENVHFLEGDVRDFAFPAGHFDAIFHGAAPAVTGLMPGVMRSIIMEGTEHTLKFARHCGAEKFLFVSSGAVYGIQPPELCRIPEDFPCSPVTEYGIAKLDAEEMCKASGIFTLLPRCFAFTGVYLPLDIHFAAGNFIRDALKGGVITVQGDGTPFRSYLDADDLVDWLFRILDCGQDSRPYNVGSPDAVSIAQLAERVASCFATPPEVRILGIPEPGRLPSRYVPSTERAALELGLRVKVDLTSSLKKTLALLGARNLH